MSSERHPTCRTGKPEDVLAKGTLELDDALQKAQEIAEASEAVIPLPFENGSYHNLVGHVVRADHLTPAEVEFPSHPAQLCTVSVHSF